MDATPRKTVAVTIAGRHVDLMMPTADQMLGLRMLDKQNLPENTQLDAVMGLFSRMMPTDEDRVWFVTQLTLGDYTVNDLMDSLKAIGTSPTAVEEQPAKTAPRTRKTAAKKTPAKKATARPRT